MRSIRIRIAQLLPGEWGKKFLPRQGVCDTMTVTRSAGKGIRIFVRGADFWRFVLWGRGDVMEPKKRNDLMWSFSLMVIGSVTAVLAGTNILDMELPDPVRWVVGVAELVALVTLVYSTVKKIRDRG